MKKIIAILLAMLMLAGCQQAGKETQEDQLLDKMVGIFVTFESLELEFDIDGLLRDDHEALHGDGVSVSDPEYLQYAGKLPVEVTDEGWVLPGYEGIFFGRLLKEDHSLTVADEGVSDVHTDLATGDDGETVRMEGVICFAENSEVKFYANPMYRNEAGEYYVVQGDAIQTTMGLGATSQCVSHELTWTEEGEQKSYAAEFLATAQGVTVAEKVKLIWMGEDDTQLKREEYVPGQLPESIEADAAYLMVLEESNGVILTRTLYQPGDESVTVYYQSEQPWCLPDVMQINWHE